MTRGRLMFVIFILSVLLAYVAGTGLHSQYVDRLAARNAELENLKQRTELFVDQNMGYQAKQVFLQLGYAVHVPVLDSVGDE